MTVYAGGQAGESPVPLPPGTGLPRSSGIVCNQSGSNSGPSDEPAGPQEVALSPLQGPRPTDPATALGDSQGPAETSGRRGAESLLSPSPGPSRTWTGRPTPHLAARPPPPPYAPGAKTRLPRCAGSQDASARRWRGRLRSGRSYLQKRKRGEDCTCAGRLGRNGLLPTVKMATGRAHAHTPSSVCRKEGSTAGPGGGPM